jgi:hypothetical protein
MSNNEKKSYLFRSSFKHLLKKDLQQAQRAKLLSSNSGRHASYSAYAIDPDAGISYACECEVGELFAPGVFNIVFLY